MKLRRNWAVEEMVAHFTQARGNILAFARKPPSQEESRVVERPKKRRKVETPTSAPERRSTRSQSRKAVQSASQASFEEMESTQEEVADSEEEGSIYTAKGREQDLENNHEPHDGLVACPCCHRRMKEASINAHLDRCIQGLPTSPSPPVLQPVSNGVAANATLSYAQRTKSPLTAAQKERLPTINYSLYTETSLRKKLKELGIPSHGSKELMRRRHTEWMNLWNANCDSLQPKAKSVLLKELDTWERTLGKQLEKGVTSSSSGVMVKDFDRDGWAKTQKGEFDELIRKAREQRKAASTLKGPDETSKPAGDMLMRDAPDAVSTPTTENLSSQVHNNHDATLGLNADLQSLPVPASGAKEIGEQIETDGVSVASHNTRNMLDGSGTTMVEHGSIDISSSPVAGPNDQSPEKQRSSFFA